jgi:adenylosuccinate lyase
MADFDNYLSPFSWRYASNEMRAIWSESNKRFKWREIWVWLAQAQQEFGLVDTDQVEDLKSHINQIDIEQSLKIEAEIHHDLMAEVMVFASQCPLGGKIIHLGATSMDIEDNADILRIGQSLDLLINRLEVLLSLLCEKITSYADLVVMAYTHLQPAEPTTLGYRLSLYAQDLLSDWYDLTRLKANLRGKGFKGAVGNSASYAELIGIENLPKFEKRLSELLGLSFFQITTQVYPRKQDYQIISALAGLGQSLYKFAFDLRILQSPMIGDLAEPFGAKQVGSSAMPFKRNPIQSEKIDSLTRNLAQMPHVAWQNAAHSLLERTLDDSANRRTLLPEAFLICDELLLTMHKIVDGLQINHSAIQNNLTKFSPFSCTERLLMGLVHAGADRQEMHARLREHSLLAWSDIQKGQENPLPKLVSNDPAILAYLSKEVVENLMQVEGYTGNAAQSARAFAESIHALLSKPANHKDKTRR